MRLLARPSLLLLLVIPSVFSQPRVDLRNLYERVLCVVPLVGAGTADDPRRPMFAPVPRPGEPPAQDGIIAFSFQLSDDGQRALVEFVARDRSAFQEILKANRGDVKVFERGKARREEVEREFRRHKKDFDFSRWGVMVP